MAIQGACGTPVIITYQNTVYQLTQISIGGVSKKVTAADVTLITDFIKSLLQEKVKSDQPSPEKFTLNIKKETADTILVTTLIDGQVAEERITSGTSTYDRVQYVFQRQLESLYPPLAKKLETIELDEVNPPETKLGLSGDALKAAQDSNPILQSYGSFGTESIEEIFDGKSTLDYVEQMLLARRAALEEYSSNSSKVIFDSEIAAARSELLDIENQIIRIQKYRASTGLSWLTSNYWRELLTNLGDYFRSASQYIIAPINMRFQSLLAPENGPHPKAQEIGVLRTAMITDLRNGWYPLSALKFLQQNPEKIETFLLETLKTLAKDIKIHPVGNSSTELMVYLETEILSMISTQPDKKLRCQAIQYVLGELRAIQEGQLEKIITERRRVLSDQMIILLQVQLLKNAHLIRDNKFTLTVLSLLKGYGEHKFDPSGWMHDEPTAIADMGGILQEFEGKTIIFEENCVPKVEGNTIYLPKIKGIEQSEIQLKTNHINISPQGKTLNRGMQKVVNESGFSKLISEHPDIKDILLQQYQLLCAQGGSYNIAEDVATALIKRGHALVVVCASTKDRSGAFLARLIQRAIEDKYHFDSKANPFAKYILDPEYPASKIAYKNTGKTALKVVPVQRGITLDKYLIRGLTGGLTTLQARWKS